jgi:hypothetical protein
MREHQGIKMYLESHDELPPFRSVGRIVRQQRVDVPSIEEQIEMHTAKMALTKREYFAAMALQGVLGNSRVDCTKQNAIIKTVISIADQLIAELEKK